MLDKPSKYCVGSIANGYSEEIAVKIFEMIEHFAAYGFNKAHSLAYAVLGFKTAWLSCHYPVEYAVGCLSVEEKEEKRISTFNLCKKREIKLLPPSVNTSRDSFTVEMFEDKKAIRFGMRGIKGVGDSALAFLTRIKNRVGEFLSFDDFLEKVHKSPEAKEILTELGGNSDKKVINPIKKDVIVALIKSGAFDEFEKNRHALLLYYLKDIRREKEEPTHKPPKGTADKDLYKPIPIELNNFTRRMMLLYEKELLGYYVSEHPLEPYPYKDLGTVSDNSVVTITGIVKSKKKLKTKGGKDYLNIGMETKDGTIIYVKLFGKTVALYGKEFQVGGIVIVNGEYSTVYNSITLKKVIKQNIISNNNTVVDNNDNVEDVNIDNPTVIVKDDPLFDF